MGWDKEKVAQLQLPDPADADPHPPSTPGGGRCTRWTGFYSLVSRWVA